MMANIEFASQSFSPLFLRSSSPFSMFAEGLTRRRSAFLHGYFLNFLFLSCMAHLCAFRSSSLQSLLLNATLTVQQQFCLQLSFFRRIMNVHVRTRTYLSEAALAGPRDDRLVALFLLKARLRADTVFPGQRRYYFPLPLSFSCDFYCIPDTHVRCSLACAFAPHAVTTDMTQTSRGKKYWGISLLCTHIYTAGYDI